MNEKINNLLMKLAKYLFTHDKIKLEEVIKCVEEYDENYGKILKNLGEDGLLGKAKDLMGGASSLIGKASPFLGSLSNDEENDEKNEFKAIIKQIENIVSDKILKTKDDEMLDRILSILKK